MMGEQDEPLPAEPQKCLRGSFGIHGRVVGLPAMLSMAEAYALALPSALRDGDGLIIGGGDADRIDMIVCVLGCLLAGVKPILDEKNLLLAGGDAALGQGCYAPAPALPHKAGQETCSLEQAEALLARLFALAHSPLPALSLATSGSSGDPKLIDKHWRALQAEACALAAWHQLRAGDKVVALVSPFHIYGFLHTVMQVLVAGAQVLFVPAPMQLLSEACGVHGRIDLLVAVPPLWPIVKLLASRVGIGALVSSGARFGPLRTKDLMASELAIDHACEIFGSTETGGIGTRDLKGEPDGPFTLCRGLRLTPIDVKEGRYTLHSPYLYPHSSCVMDDDLQLVDEQHFYHLGRADSVFKYSGKRYALAEIERAMAAVVGHENVFCLFRPRADHSKGGELLALIETAIPLDVDQLRRGYLKSAKTPPPERFIMVAELPRDLNGKVERAALIALADKV